MTCVPYLHFQGDCAEAMAFYAEVFGSEPPRLMRYTDAPPSEEIGRSDKVMHAELTIGAGKLMGSDFPPGMEGEPQRAVSVMHPVADAETGRRIYQRLREGGATIMDFAPTFWSQGFGMVRDRFGTHWMIAAP
jgi:PhnB protein